MKIKGMTIKELFVRYRAHIMGICIIWIILFHSGIEASEQPILRIAYYLFVSFGGGLGVNIFLICSGFGLTHSAVVKSDAGIPFSTLGFYKKRILRILPAYLIVASIWYLIKFEGAQRFFYNLSLLNFLVDGERDFWYIACILVCYLLFPLYFYFSRKIGYRLSTVLMLLINSAVCFAVYFVSSEYFDKQEVLLFRLFCFWFGCYIAVLLENKKERECIVTVFALAMLSAAMMSTLGFIHTRYKYVERIELVLISPLVMVVFAWVVSKLERIAKWFTDLLEKLGRITLELYLIHVSIGAYIASSVNNIVGGTIISRLFLCFAISIALSYVLHYILGLIPLSSKNGRK